MTSSRVCWSGLFPTEWVNDLPNCLVNTHPRIYADDTHLTFTSNNVPLTGTVALSWLSGLCVPATPRAMPAGVFTPLVGPPKPERSRRGVQTKDSPTALQAWGLGLRLTTLSCKKELLWKQQQRQPISCAQTFQGLRNVVMQKLVRKKDKLGLTLSLPGCDC